MASKEFRADMTDTWKALFPEVPSPGDDQWALWLLLHDEEIVRVGIAQLAAKYRKLDGQMDRGYMARFASSVMNRLERERTTS